MEERIEKIIRDVFTPPDNEGESKVVGLKEAISKHLKPGMSIYFPFTTVRGPYSAVYEITRQYYGKDPKFEVLSMDVGGPFLALYATGLIKKTITSFLANPYYYPAPCVIYQKALEEGSELEHCSLFTFTERTRAGAMGLPYMPTKSIIGSTMAEEHKDTVKIVDDPFGSDQKLALVKAIVPDIAVVHGWAADEYGNTIVLPPYGDGYYGALGSKNGVLVTVEKIVSTEFIRRYAAFVKIPGYLVKTVTRVPFGAHPGGMYNAGLAEFEGYLEDYDYYAMVQKASKDPEQLEQWIKGWILDCPDHDAYLNKLGTEKIQYLKGRAHPDSWQYELNRLSASVEEDRPFNQLEILIAAASRKLIEKVKTKGHKTVIAGAGLAFLSAGLSKYKLQELKHDVEMVVEMGLYGLSPKPAEPFIVSHIHFSTCKMLTGADTMMGILVGGANNKCIGMLGTAQIDKHGNINTSRIDGKHLIGSGGSNDICSAASEVIAVIIQSPGRVVEKVDYITSPGAKVSCLVTNLGVFEKIDGNDYFSLTSYFPDEGRSPEQIIENIKALCGWKLEVSPNIAEALPPTPEELQITRLLDPQGYHIGKQLAARLKK